MNRVLPERVKRWYKSKPIVPTSSSPKIKRTSSNRRNNTRIPSTTSRVLPSVIQTMKHIDQKSKLSVKLTQTTVKKNSITPSHRIEEEKLKINTQNTMVLESGMHEAKKVSPKNDHRLNISSVVAIDNVNNSIKVQHDEAAITKDTTVTDQSPPVIF